MELWQGIVIAFVFGVILALLILWLWPDRRNREKAIPKMVGVLVFAVVATIVMSRVGSELGMPGAVIVANIYFGVGLVGWFIANKRSAT